MELTRRQRNEIFETLTASGIDPKDCDLDTEHGQLTHLPTESYFRFTYFQTYSTSWYVADGPDESGWGTGGKSWEGVLEQLAYWADEVRYVTETPDFWAELEQVPEILAAAQAADASNAPFTPDEQAEISTRIDQAMGYAKDVVRRENPELAAERLAAIEQRLDEVKDASTRVGRKDWLLQVSGTVLNLIVTDLVPPHVVQSIFNVLITGIGHIFGIGGPPPIIST